MFNIIIIFRLKNFIFFFCCGLAFVFRRHFEICVLIFQSSFQTHRVRALELLARFVDLGSWAVIAALSVGIFPYVLKLLQCGTRELRPALAFIWAKILAVDPVCQIELIKDNGFIYFLNILNDSTVQSQLKIVPAFVLAMLIYNNYRPAQKKLIEADYVSVCVSLLSDNSVTKCRMLCLWLLIGLGRLWVEYDEARWLATRNVTYERVEEFLDDDAPEVRAAAVYALGCLVHNRSHNNEHATIVDSDICRILCDKCSFDGSVLVRTEFLAAIQWFLIDFENEFLDFHTKLEVEIELTAAKKRKQAALNLSNSSIRRSSSSAANSKHAQKQQQQQQQQTSGVKRKVSLMARNNSAILTPHENSKLRLYEEMKFLEAKTFKTSFERIWLTLLRLCFDSYEQVSSMCLKLVNHILDVSTKRKSERVASLLAERARGAINNPPHRSSNASAGSSVDIVGATVGDGVESASSAAVVGSNNNNVRFMIGSPGAVSAVGATSMIPLVGLPFAAVGHNVSNSAGGATGGTLTAVENLQQQLRECTSVADMVSNGLIETATTNFAPKRNLNSGNKPAKMFEMLLKQICEIIIHFWVIYFELIFGSQSGRYSSSGANPDEEAVTASALLLGNKEIVSTKFVQWCSMLFTQPIYKTIYEDAQSGNTSKTPRGLLVHDADAFTIANLTDWALHTNEGLRQKAVCETEMLKNEKMRCETLHASIHNDRPVTSLAWSYLRPYVYICDGAQVAIHNYRQSKKSCGFSAYTQTLIQDTITDLLPINGRTHELLITGTENGLIQAWDPMFCEHSHEIQDKPKLITTAYVLSDQSRISTQKNAKNRTLYRWDQTFGRLACTGNVRVCRLWDSRAEKGVLDLELKNRNHSVTSVAMDLSVNLVACGFVDGTVKVYDVRLPVAENLLMELRHFTMPIVGSCLHSDGRLTVGSSYGDLRTWEMRMFCEPTVEFHAVNENEASMQQMDVQSTAGIVGCALSNGTVRMFDLTGDQRCVSQMTPFPPPSSSSSAVSRFGLSALTASYATPTATTTKSANAAAAAAATDLFSTLHFHQGQLLLAVGGRNNVYVYGVPAVV